jgi:poly [ADP-ribose] polymerase
MVPMDKSSERYKLLVEYVKNTHASTHTAYRLDVEDIFEISKDSENRRYK